MNYELRHFDTPLMRFSASEDSNSPEITLLWLNDEKKHLLPLDLEPTETSIAKWLRHRIIPKNRAYVQSLLSKCGLSINRPMSVIRFSKGLSLNDCFWVAEEGFDGTFDKYNLYDNNFNRVLGLVAFMGYGSSIRSSVVSSPEFTTNGMLPKCWRRESGKVMLYKGGTSGASNTGCEPYSEYYAAQIADILGVNSISYNLKKWRGILCSTCELFTSKEYSFVPVGRIVTEGGMQAVRAYYESLGDEFIRELDDMLVFDAVIMNTDRHFGNFGFLVDNRTNTISTPAPLFDHGNSLFNLAGKDDLTSFDALQKYADSLQPCVYDDFIGTAKAVLSQENRQGLRKLLDFRFERHSRYNLDKKRLRLIEEMVRARARILLGKDN